MNELKTKVINGKFIAKRMAGLQRFAYEVVCEMDDLSKKGETELIIPKGSSHGLSLKNIKIVQYGRIRSMKEGSLLSHLWELLDLPFYLLTHKSTCINLNYTAPPLRTGFVFLHDINYRTHPQYFTGVNKIHIKLHYLSYWYVCKFAKHIFTDSECTKSMVVKVYKVLPQRITVVGCGWQHYERVDFDDSIYDVFQELKGRPFFFSLGSLDVHKNISWVLAAAKRNQNYLFCITGEESVNKEKYVDIPSNVIFTGRLNDSHVKTLMRDCKAFIFPSFCEGFGIPPLEALSVGARIIVSNATCLPEIYEDSAVYIDPNNPNVDMDELLMIETEDPQRILDKYSWGKTAALIFETVDDVLMQERK